MENEEPKIIKHEPKSKIVFCAYCYWIDDKAKEKLRVYNKTWSDKWYNLSHGICKECAKIHF